LVLRLLFGCGGSGESCECVRVHVKEGGKWGSQKKRSSFFFFFFSFSLPPPLPYVVLSFFYSSLVDVEAGNMVGGATSVVANVLNWVVGSTNPVLLSTVLGRIHSIRVGSTGEVVAVASDNGVQVRSTSGEKELLYAFGGVEDANNRFDIGIAVPLEGTNALAVVGGGSAARASGVVMMDMKEGVGRYEVDTNGEKVEMVELGRHLSMAATSTTCYLFCTDTGTVVDKISLKVEGGGEGGEQAPPRSRVAFLSNLNEGEESAREEGEGGTVAQSRYGGDMHGGELGTLVTSVMAEDSRGMGGSEEGGDSEDESGRMRDGEEGWAGGNGGEDATPCVVASAVVESRAGVGEGHGVLFEEGTDVLLAVRTRDKVILYEYKRVMMYGGDDDEEGDSSSMRSSRMLGRSSEWASLKEGWRRRRVHATFMGEKILSIAYMCLFRLEPLLVFEGKKNKRPLWKSYLIMGSESGQYLYVYPAEKGRDLCGSLFRGQSSAKIHSIKAHLNGCYIVVLSSTKTIHIFDMKEFFSMSNPDGVKSAYRYNVRDGVAVRDVILKRVEVEEDSIRPGERPKKEKLHITVFEADKVTTAILSNLREDPKEKEQFVHCEEKWLDRKE